MIIPVRLNQSSYDIYLERGCLQRAGELLDLDRRVLIVTDEGVPASYAKAVAEKSADPHIETVPAGEASKSFEMLQKILSRMLALRFSRKDCVVAVGGGVPGDLAGLAAAVYMRGIDFYNIPTTVLSQVDSSIGGKTAIDLDGIKNIVGAFYQPKRVLIDPDVLGTLPKRQISNGLAEAVKMSLTSDVGLFTLFEKDDPLNHIDEIIERSLRIKAAVVEADEKESGLRRVLNFGHTIGHGIEAYEGLHGLYHGECVALGMIPMCSGPVRSRLIPVLKKLDLPVSCPVDDARVCEAIAHDKKAADDMVTAVRVDEPGSFRFCQLAIPEIKDLIGVIS